MLALAGVSVIALPSANVSAATTSTPWPTTPDRQMYNQAPSSASVCPVAVVSTSGTVSGAANLLCAGSGGATLTRTSGGATPTLVLDYGRDVGGIPFFVVSSASGSPQLKAGYAESRRYLTADGGEDPPWGEGDPARSDTYPVTGPGTITNRYTQGGERYQEITLTSTGSVTLSGIGITYIADRTQASAYPGYFISSSDQLNRIWYDSAYTAQLDSVPLGSLPGAWRIQNGVLNALGGTGGLLNAGSAWGDYSATFETSIVNAQAGWMVRGRDPGNGYLFILDAADDPFGAPNTLQEFDVHDGIFTSVGSVGLPTALSTGTWHTVGTTVSGTALSVSLDGTQIASLNSASFPAGTVTFAGGSVGFRESGSEQATFRNLRVVSSGGSTLYSNALSTDAAVRDFAVPGVNTLPSIVDGARRDRAIWSGDLDIEGPSVYYSTGTSAYLKGSLQLLGSYQLSSGFVTGDLPPQTALHTGAKTPGTVGTYSASYSMYYVLGLAGYYLYTGDSAFLTSQWPIAQAELDWNATQVDSRGLFVTNSGDGSDWDFYDPAKSGAVSEVNMIYYKALLGGAQMAAAVGQAGLATTYTTRAAALRTAINTYLFNSAKGLYTISDTNAAVPQDANSLAVLYGVAQPAQVASILARLKTALWTSPYGPLPYSADAGYRAVISPFISGYELRARLLANDTANAESLLGNLWGHMIAAGPDQTGTMWENVLASDGTPGLGSTTNLSHGWSTGPTSALSGDVLGIRPVTAGYATWQVQPHPGSLSWAQGRAPTPHGPVSVSWAGRSGVQQFSMEVTAPAGTSGTIAVPTYGASNPIVAVNGNPVWHDGAFTATTGVSGAHADPNFVYLTGVQPGTYTVGANPGNAGVPTGYTLCATENGTCAVSGAQSVAFGANGIYSYQNVTGSVGCSPAALSDVDYGFVKSCYTGPVVTGPSGSAFCAPENGLCSFTGTRTVAYGAGSTFTTRSLSGGTACSNAVFADPLPNVVKSCYLT